MDHFSNLLGVFKVKKIVFETSCRLFFHNEPCEGRKIYLILKHNFLRNAGDTFNETVQKNSVKSIPDPQVGGQNLDTVCWISAGSPPLKSSGIWVLPPRVFTFTLINKSPVEKNNLKNRRLVALMYIHICTYLYIL